jgi:hypothetical protein
MALLLLDHSATPWDQPQIVATSALGNDRCRPATGPIRVKPRAHIIWIAAGNETGIVRGRRVHGNTSWRSSRLRQVGLMASAAAVRGLVG